MSAHDLAKGGSTPPLAPASSIKDRFSRAPRAYLSSLLVSLAVMVCLDGFAYLYVRDRLMLARLSSYNDIERTLSTLFEGLKDRETFGEVIESSEPLRGKIIGLAIYARDGSSVYAWGDSPKSFKKEDFEPQGPSGQVDMLWRQYQEKSKNDAVILLAKPSQLRPRPPMEDDRGQGAKAMEKKRPQIFETLRKGDVVYLEVRQSAYWASRRLQYFALALAMLIIAVGVFFVRSIFLRNQEYRRRIEAQKNLVVLGTAASTLAHEIKTPLLGIRLQTSILEKLYPQQASRELGIINQEIERLSRLSYRVNDYLREPRGHQQRIIPANIANDVGQSLLGRPVAVGDLFASVNMDPDRFRSVLENLLRNAQEAGGSEDDISVAIEHRRPKVIVDVLDRGAGVGEKDKERLFQAFFTTKSRGSGIGLSVCHRFVTSVGGRIWLSDREGGGTRVRLELPEAI